MIPTNAYFLKPEWSYGPVVIFILLTVTMAFFLIQSSVYRTIVGYCAFTAAVAGFIYTTVIVASCTIEDDFTPTFLEVNHGFCFFYGIYAVFAFFPAFITLYRLSKQLNDKLGTVIVYFAYLWSAIIVLVGFSLTIIAATKFTSFDMNYYEIKAAKYYGNVLLFFYYANWVFVPAILALHVIHFYHLHGKARLTLVIYTALNIFSIIFTAVFLNATYHNSVVQMVTAVFWSLLFLVDIPVVASLLVALIYGRQWQIESPDDKFELSSQQHQNI